MSSIIKGSQYDGIDAAIPTLVNCKDDKKTPIQQPAATIYQPVDLQEQSKIILSGAFDKAKKIVDAAQNYTQSQIKEATERMNQECVQIKRQSHDQGYALGMIEGKNAGKSAGYREGYEEGLQKAAAESRQAADELSRMIEAVESSKSKILEKFNDDLESLAVTIAKKIVKKELSIDQTAMHAIIMNAIDSYRNESWVRICVSKDTAGVLLKADNNLIEALQSVSDSIKVIASPEMSDGDCTIDMPDQVIDAGVDTQIRTIQAALKA